MFQFRKLHSYKSSMIFSLFLDKHQAVMIVLLDLSAAFDTFHSAPNVDMCDYHHTVPAYESVGYC